MKSRIVLAVLLLLHVLAHPALHALVPAGEAAPVLRSSTESDGGAADFTTLGPCLGCQTSSSLLASPAAATSLPPPPRWENLSPASPSYESGASDWTFSARAPPLS
ncbi:MAG: hypothetical protein ACE5IP_06645 [Terriglobia bacterium]